MNCPNCGAVLVDNRCEYCGYENIKKKVSHDVHVYHHNADNQHNNVTKPKKTNTAIVVLLWFLFLPFMIFYTIWKSKKLPIKTKIILTIVVAAIFITMGVISDNNSTATNVSDEDKNISEEEISDQDWNIDVYNIKLDYDIDNQTVILIDLKIEYIGEYAFEVSPADLDFTLKNSDDYIFLENKYYGKKDLEVELKTNDKYTGTIGFNIDLESISDFILNITCEDYERKCDINLIIEESKITDALKNLD